MKRVIPFLVLFLTGLSLFAQKLTVDINATHPYVLENEKQINYFKIGLTGFEMKNTGKRPQVNAAIVLDRSGSMDGEKLSQAKRAAHTAIDLLENGDIVSLVIYSDGAEVLVPSSPLNRQQRRLLHRKIDSIESSGSTALFAGVVAGADQLERYMNDYRVNRVILLSDGLANVGPDSPHELGNLGRVLGGKGISVTTIGLGLGYNSDLMYSLAANSDGNHSFVENPKDLAVIFEREFSSMMTVVAQDITIRINCAPGVKPLRIMNREGEIYGSNVILRINQIYSNQEQYAIVQVEVDPSISRNQSRASDVTVQYINMKSRVKDTVNDGVALAYTTERTIVREKQDDDTLADVTLQLATETNVQAMELRSEGKIEEAEELLEENAMFLKDSAGKLDLSEEKAKILDDYAETNLEDAEVIATEDDEDWEGQKKSMRERQFKNRNQQVY